MCFANSHSARRGRNANCQPQISAAFKLAFSDIGSRLKGTTWQERLRSLFHSFRKILQLHPNLAPFVATEMSYNASVDASLIDVAVSILEDAGFSEAGIGSAFKVVIVPTLEMSTTAPEKDWEELCQKQISAIDRMRRPKLGQDLNGLANNAFILRWSNGMTRPLDSSFDLWIDVTNAGLEAAVKK